MLGLRRFAGQTSTIDLDLPSKQFGNADHLPLPSLYDSVGQIRRRINRSKAKATCFLLDRFDERGPDALAAMVLAN